jgi:hypothetical protein
MSGKWNPVLLSTGQHPRCGPIRWPTVSRFYAALCQTGPCAPFLARDVGSNGGFEAVIPDRWRSAFGRSAPIDADRSGLDRSYTPVCSAISRASLTSMPR